MTTANQNPSPLDQNTFQDNRQYAVWVSLTNLYSFTPNNTFTIGIGNVVKVNSLTIPQDLTLFTGFTYSLSSLTIPTGVVLTIQPGTVVKLSGSLTVNGTLTSSGTAANPVYITSWKDDTVGGDSNADGANTSPAPGDWGEIQIHDGVLNLDYTTVRYGGNSSYYGGVIGQSYYADSYSQWYSNAQITINHSTISNNGISGVYLRDYTDISGTLTILNSAIQDNSGYGVYVESGFPLVMQRSVVSGNSNTGLRFSSHSPLDLNDNVLSSNNGYAADISISKQTIGLSGNEGSGNKYNVIGLKGTFDTQSLVPQGSLVYEMSGTVPTDKTLTLQPGTVVKVYPADSFTVSGTLTSSGTAANPVYITSWKDDTVGGDSNADGANTSPAPGDWGEIQIHDGVLNLDYTTVRYGGNSSYYGGVIGQSYYADSYSQWYSNAQITINHSTISNNGISGVLPAGLHGY